MLINIQRNYLFHMKIKITDVINITLYFINVIYSLTSYYIYECYFKYFIILK